MRNAAAGALGALGAAAAPAAVTPLVAALRDTDPYVRTAAAGALGSLGAAAVPDMVEAYRQEVLIRADDDFALVLAPILERLCSFRRVSGGNNLWRA